MLGRKQGTPPTEVKHAGTRTRACRIVKKCEGEMQISIMRTEHVGRGTGRAGNGSGAARQVRQYTSSRGSAARARHHARNGMYAAAARTPRRRRKRQSRAQQMLWRYRVRWQPQVRQQMPRLQKRYGRGETKWQGVLSPGSRPERGREPRPSYTRMNIRSNVRSVQRDPCPPPTRRKRMWEGGEQANMPQNAAKATLQCPRTRGALGRREGKGTSRDARCANHRWTL